MRVVRRFRTPVSAACQYWRAVAAASPPAEPIRPTVDHYQRQAQITRGAPASSVFETIRERLLAYDVFPSWFMQYAICPPDRITPEAIIVQRVLLGPVALEMAVRVLDVWDRHEDCVRDVGFSYETIEGHAERGVATFTVKLYPDQRVDVILGARSEPGAAIARLARPGARLVQRTMTKAALRRLCG